MVMKSQRGEPDGGLAHLHVHVAAVEIDRLDRLEVALERLLAVRAALGDRGEEAALLCLHHRGEIALRDVRVPDELDLPHLDLGLLVDDVDDVDLVVRERLEPVGDLGEVVALLDVLVLDLLDVLLDLGEVEDRVGLHLDGVLQVVLGELLVAGDLRLANGGLLHHAVDEHRAGGIALRLHHHVGEEAELHQGPDVLVDLLAVVRRALLLGDDGLDRVHLDAAVALDPQVLHHRPLHGRGRGRGEREEERGERGGEVSRAEDHGAAESRPRSGKPQTFR
jgi:hypothetical protein